MHKALNAAFLAVLPALLLTGCDNVAEMAGADSRPTVEIQGELVVLMLMGTVDPNRGRTFGGQTVMVKYKPGHEAVVYTSPDTEFVNVESKGGMTTYETGKEYLVRGYETKPIMKKAADGSEYYSAPRGVDRWIEATHVELLKEQGDDDEN